MNECGTCGSLLEFDFMRFCHYLVILTVQSLSLLGITVLLFPVGSPCSSGVTVV
jgi:hypothetical protein